MAFDGAQFLRNPIRFDRMDTMMPGVIDTPDVAKAPETGRLAGATVVVQSDAAAELMDSMEELSMQFEEKASKRISERKLGETRGRSSYVDAVEKWMKTMPDMPDKKDIENLLKMLRNSRENGNMPDVLRFSGMLAKLSSDPSHQFAMLDILEQAMTEQDGELKGLVESMRKSLMQTRGAEVVSGINLAQEVNARSTTPEEMSELRNLYRSEILGFKSPQDCFRSILSSRGASAMDAATDFLIKGCGIDLASATPSRDPVELRRIMQDLQCVQVLKTVLGMMGDLGGRMTREFGVRMLLDSSAMTSRIVDFTEKPCLGASEIGSFVSECAVMKLLAQMDFTREIMSVFRKLSPRLFSTEDDREKLLNSAQEHLDALIAQEIDPDEGGQQ